ncbi:MAG TPA: hypothetical protein PLH94_13290 [Fimbriimonadaceae bacterium]|nr:hypothetical protein [Fimbriimonadaceae bacterium]
MSEANRVGVPVRIGEAFEKGSPGTPGMAMVVQYRLQAYANNAPTGPYSAIVQVTTIP